MFMQCVGSHMRNNFFVQIVTAQKSMLQLTEGAAEMTAWSKILQEIECLILHM
jgi:hypothetical protein